MKIRGQESRSRRERGSVVVETALLLPVLLLVTAGLIDLGYIFWEKSVLTNAVREGARAGVRTGVGGTCAHTQTAVMGVVSTYLTNYGISTNLVLGGNFTYTVDTSVTPNRVTVALTGIPYTMMFLPSMQAFFGGSGSSTIDLSASVTMAAQWTTAPP